MISINNYRKCGIAINLLKILNNEAPDGIIMWDTSLSDVQHVIYGICNVRAGYEGSINNREGQLHIVEVNKHKKSEIETRKHLEDIVKKLGDEYYEQVKIYESIFKE